MNSKKHRIIKKIFKFLCVKFIKYHSLKYKEKIYINNTEKVHTAYITWNTFCQI